VKKNKTPLLIVGVIVLAVILILIFGVIINSLTKSEINSTIVTPEGCLHNNPSCQSDFGCINNSCELKINVSPHDLCSAADSQTVCTQNDVIVKGPANASDVLAQHAKFLQSQYEFMAFYLGYEPTKKLVREYTDNFYDYCPRGSIGCAVQENSYYPTGTLSFKWSPADHEFNHAFSFDISMDPDFNEAQARYMTLKERQYAFGYSQLGDFLKLEYDHEGYFYTFDEEKWGDMINGSAEEACKTISVSEPKGIHTQDFKVQCEYLFMFIKYDSQKMLPFLMKSAFDKQIDVSTKEHADQQIAQFISSVGS